MNKQDLAFRRSYIGGYETDITGLEDIQERYNECEAQELTLFVHPKKTAHNIPIII